MNVRSSSWGQSDDSDTSDADCAERSRRHSVTACVHVLLSRRRHVRPHGETRPVQPGRPGGLQRGRAHQRRRAARPDQRHQAGNQGLFRSFSAGASLPPVVITPRRSNALRRVYITLPLRASDDILSAPCEIKSLF